MRTSSEMLIVTSACPRHGASRALAKLFAQWAFEHIGDPGPMRAPSVSRTFSIPPSTREMSDLRGNAFALTDEAEQDVLGADVVVAETQRLPKRELEHLLRARRERHVSLGPLRPAPDAGGDLFLHGVERQAERP